MEQRIIEMLAGELLAAEDTCTPIVSLTERYPDMTIDDGYAIQKCVVAKKLARGEVVIGKKIGLTSEGMRERIGIHEPDYGVMTDRGLILDGKLHMDTLIKPRIESEIAFILKEDLDKKVVSHWDVIRATAGVMPALELVDSRIKDWKIKIQDTVADAASYARVITGGNRVIPIDGLDLSMIPMAAYKNGQLVSTGCSAAVMGNPLNAMVWLANKMVHYGTPLRAGELVLSGAFTGVFAVEPGDHVDVRMGTLGSVILDVV